jgi:hypothetical protein
MGGVHGPDGRPGGQLEKVSGLEADKSTITEIVDVLALVAEGAMGPPDVRFEREASNAIESGYVSSFDVDAVFAASQD